MNAVIDYIKTNKVQVLGFALIIIAAFLFSIEFSSNAVTNFITRGDEELICARTNLECIKDRVDTFDKEYRIFPEAGYNGVQDKGPELKLDEETGEYKWGVGPSRPVGITKSTFYKLESLQDMLDRMDRDNDTFWFTTYNRNLAALIRLEDGVIKYYAMNVNVGGEPILDFIVPIDGLMRNRPCWVDTSTFPDDDSSSVMSDDEFNTNVSIEFNEGKRLRGKYLFYERVRSVTGVKEEDAVDNQIVLFNNNDSYNLLSYDLAAVYVTDGCTFYTENLGPNKILLVRSLASSSGIDVFNVPVKRFIEYRGLTTVNSQRLNTRTYDFANNETNILIDNVYLENDEGKLSLALGFFTIPEDARYMSITGVMWQGWPEGPGSYLPGFQEVVGDFTSGPVDFIF